MQRMRVQEVLLKIIIHLKQSITITEGEIQELENEILDCKKFKFRWYAKAKRICNF